MVGKAAVGRSVIDTSWLCQSVPRRMHIQNENFKNRNGRFALLSVVRFEFLNLSLDLLIGTTLAVQQFEGPLTRRSPMYRACGHLSRASRGFLSSQAGSDYAREN